VAQISANAAADKRYSLDVNISASMRSITSPRDARRVRDLPFCYSCGQHFAAHDVINHDHIPPQSIFAKEDRNFPLKLAAHEKCHAPQNLDDEVMGQLVSLIHGKTSSPLGDQLKIELYQRTDTLAYMAAFSRRNLEFLMRRWLKAFHAALYGEPLLEGAKFAIQTPFPSGTPISRPMSRVKNSHAT
jgi:hypothetical protein